MIVARDIALAEFRNRIERGEGLAWEVHWSRWPRETVAAPSPNPAAPRGAIISAPSLGPAAPLAQDCIRSVEIFGYPELGTEAGFKIEVEEFPAFVVVDDKSNDFFSKDDKKLVGWEPPA